MALYQYRQDPYGFESAAQSYQTQRGLTTGSRLSAPEWRGMVSGYNQANYQNALEWARLAEQTRQAELNRQTQEDVLKRQEGAAQVKGIGQALGGIYSGYKMGQDVGLWGGKPTTATPGGTGQTASASAPVGALESVAAPTTEGLLSRTTLGGGAIPETLGGTVAGGVGQGVGTLGSITGATELGAGLAPAAAEAGGEAIAAAPAFSTLGPAAMAVGAIPLLTSLFGIDLGFDKFKI